MTVRDIVILGSTGSIGTQALDLVRANPDRFRVVGLTAGGSNRALFDAQVAEFAPAYSGLGEEASTEAAGRACDVVLNGITGAVGLRPTLAGTAPETNGENVSMMMRAGRCGTIKRSRSATTASAEAACSAVRMKSER